MLEGSPGQERDAFAVDNENPFDGDESSALGLDQNSDYQDLLRKILDQAISKFSAGPSPGKKKVEKDPSAATPGQWTMVEKMVVLALWIMIVGGIVFMCKRGNKSKRFFVCCSQT